MTQWAFSGLVHPQRAGLTIERVHVSGSNRDGNLSVECAFTVSRGLISGYVMLPPEQDRDTARMVAHQVVQNHVDLRGFVEAAGYSVEVDTVVPVDDPSAHAAFGTLVDYLASPDDTARRERLLASIPESALFGSHGLVLHAALADLRPPSCTPNTQDILPTER